MNEIMRHPVRVPKIIKVDIPVDLAYELKKMLEEYARDNSKKVDGALARHIAHKLWILLFQSKFSTRIQPSFTCLTGHWHSFCLRFMEAKLTEEPRDRDLQKIFACLSAGTDITNRGA
jgi:hypothetical protein